MTASLRFASRFSTHALTAFLLVSLIRGTGHASAQCPGQWIPGQQSIGTVRAFVTMPNGDLYAGGSTGVYRWNGSSWVILGLQGVNALANVNGDLVAGASGTGGGVFRWDNGWVPLGSGLSTVYAVTQYNNEIVAGGFFTLPDGRNVARWDGASWHSLSNTLMPSVRALTVYDGMLIAGGFLSPSPGTGAGAQGVGYWDGAAWHTLGSGLNTVRALTIHDGALIAGCQDCSERAYRWTGVTWQPLSVPGNYVWALGEFQGDLVAGGGCNCPTGPPYIHRLHNGSWQPLETVLTLNNTIQALEGRGDDLFVGGLASGWGIWRMTCPRGDLNADGLVNDVDQTILIDVLLNIDDDPDHIARADLNDDDHTDGLDIAVFTACRTGGCP